jgi:hypothetical protein
MHVANARIVGSAAMLLAFTAQLSGQELPVLGQGNLSCRSWAERRLSVDAVDAATMTAWALGYLTAYNQYAADTKGDVSKGLDTDRLTKLMDDYCRKNPTQSFYDASVALIRELQGSSAPK